MQYILCPCISWLSSGRIRGGVWKSCRQAGGRDPIDRVPHRRQVKPDSHWLYFTDKEQVEKYTPAYGHRHAIFTKS